MSDPVSVPATLADWIAEREVEWFQGDFRTRVDWRADLASRLLALSPAELATLGFQVGDEQVTRAEGEDGRSEADRAYKNGYDMGRMHAARPQPCPRCYGSGEPNPINGRRCELCGGVGVLPGRDPWPAATSAPVAMRDVSGPMAECAICAGSGRDGVRGVFDPVPANCISCGGLGYAHKTEIGVQAGGCADAPLPHTGEALP